MGPRADGLCWSHVQIRIYHVTDESAASNSGLKRKGLISEGRSLMLILHPGLTRSDFFAAKLKTQTMRADSQ